MKEIAARQAVKELAERAEKVAAKQNFQQDPPARLFTSPKLPISTPEITEANVVQATADTAEQDRSKPEQEVGSSKTIKIKFRASKAKPRSKKH